MAQDTTVRIFDAFYDLDLQVDASQYDIVWSFFKEYTSNDIVAKSYTQTLFRVASETNLNVLDLLQSFEGSDSMKVTLTMAYYLNSVSNKTVMFGVNNLIRPNNAVQRNIVQ